MGIGQIILYQTRGGEAKIEVRLANETVWLTADQMAELFQRNKSTISRLIKNILESGELQRNSVVAENATTASDGKTYKVAYYNLDMIISVGYRVNSHRGVKFRQWATQVLKEYMIKGFVLNDELLKNAGQGNYFDELLSRIRDIRSSEKVFYRKILEIYALSIDYDPRTEATQRFFRTGRTRYTSRLTVIPPLRSYSNEPMPIRISWDLQHGAVQCLPNKKWRLQKII